MENNHHQRRLPKFRRLVFFLLLIPLIFFLYNTILKLDLLPFAGANNETEPVTLSFVVPQEEAPHWQPLIAQFEAKNEGIKIKLAKFNSDNTDELKNAYITAFNNSQSYDLIYMDIIWVPEFVENDRLMDLTKEFPEKDKLKTEFFESEVYNAFYKDKLYRIPFRTDVGVLYYRKDLLDEAGFSPPKTFDDLKKISKELQKQNKARWGYLWQGRKTEALSAMFVEVLKGHGGEWINTEKKTVGLNQQEAKDAVKFLRSTIEEGISPPEMTEYEEKDTRDLFRNGQAVFMRNWPDVWDEANKPGSPVRGKIAITSMVRAVGKERSGACLGGWGFGIAKNIKPKHRQAALQAIKFFTSAAVQRQFTLAHPYVPSYRKLLLEPKIVTKYNHYPELLNVIDKSWVARPRIPEYEEASRILQEHLSAAIKGDSTADEAMDQATRETKDRLGWS
ncbi:MULTISPECIES: ABC transporter substrate-binding protein [unclassified Anabaena]|uniref:ABC transporter substrate-binding protein n=1 Tax=unclassified Anabaena TaxID=2619674 RepID=UPI0039C6A6A9